MAKPVVRDAKKPYLSPLLTIYGTVQELTQKVALRRARDGGSFPRVRTSVV
jgi:hypothetical protein